MTTTHTSEGTDYFTLLDNLRHAISKAASVEGADDVGAFHPIVQSGRFRRYGDFSSLSEWLDDVADSLEAFLVSDGDELEGWEA